MVPVFSGTALSSRARMRVFGAMVVGALVVLAGWWSVRDDPRPERSSTARAVMAPQPRAVSDAALAAAGDAAMREDVLLLTEESATTEVVADVGAAPEVAPPRSTTSRSGTAAGASSRNTAASTCGGEPSVGEVCS